MIKMVETFSGIGAQAKALSNSNVEFEILNTADWDINAIIAYDFIHSKNIDNTIYEAKSKDELLKTLVGKTLSLNGKEPATFEQICKLDKEILVYLCGAIDRTHNLISVTNIKGEDLPNDMNMLTYSFPCQDLSVAGCWHGNKGGIDRNAGNRSSMLWQIERMLIERNDKKMSMPKFLLMENVRNITSKNHIRNFEEWQKSLEKLGYYNEILTLNAKNFGIPQNRVRVFMISFLTNNDKNLENEIKAYLKNNDLMDIKYTRKIVNKKTSVSDIMRTDYNNAIYKKEAELSQPNNTKSRRDIYNNNAKIILNNDINVDYISTLTTKQDRHPNSGVVEFLNHGKENKCDFRYLTPREGFMFMGFDEEDYNKVIAPTLNKKNGDPFFTRDKLNKMAGNSIVVNVLEEIFKQINYINENILI